MRSILTDTIYLLMTLSLELSFYVTHVCYYFAGVCEMKKRFVWSRLPAMLSQLPLLWYIKATTMS